MSFIKKTNDVHFRHNRCTPTQPLKPPGPARSVTPYNAFKADAQRKFGSNSLTKDARRDTMDQVKDAQRQLPKYDTMRTDRRNRLEGLAGYGPSERPGPPRGAAPPLPGAPLPGTKYAPQWEGPLGYKASANSQKLDRKKLALSSTRVADIRASRAKGVRSRLNPNHPVRPSDQNFAGMRSSPRKDSPSYSPRAPRSGSSNAAGRSPRDTSFTSSGRNQLLGKSRSVTPRNSLDMRGSENAFNELGIRPPPTARRKITLSRGGIAPGMNQGVASLLPFVENEMQGDGKRKPLTQKRGQGHRPIVDDVFGEQTTNAKGESFVKTKILDAAKSSTLNRRNSIDGKKTKLFGGHLKDVENDRWMLLQRDQRSSAMNAETGHNHDMITGVFEMLDSDASNFIDAVELQQGLGALKLNNTKGAVDLFTKRAKEIDQKLGRENKGEFFVVSVFVCDCCCCE